MAPLVNFGVSHRLVFRGICGARVGWLKTPSSQVYVYAIGDTLIDTGPPSHARAVARFAREQGVCKVVVTHHHEDHSGGIRGLRRNLPHLRVFAPHSSLERIRNGFPMELYRKLAFFPFGTSTAEPYPTRLSAGFAVDRCGVHADSWAAVRAHVDEKQAQGAGTGTGGGPTAPPSLRLQPIHTPGHSDDHHVVLVPELGVLFSADLFITSTPAIARFDQDVYGEMVTLRHFLPRYDFDALLCAHRGLVPDGKASLQARADFLGETLAKAEAMAQSGMTVEAVSEQLLGADTWLTHASGGNFSKVNVVKSLLARGAANQYRRPQ